MVCSLHLQQLQQYCNIYRNLNSILKWFKGGVKGVAWVKGAGCSAQLPLQLIENTKFPLSRRQIIWQLLERACLAFILKLITPAEILHFA